MTKENKPLLLEMSGVSKSFQSVKALTDVSFQLRAGEVHALMGENGAGKSTLIKILAGIYSKDSGEIKINGQKVEIESVAQSHENGIAVIHQELVLVNDMSVAENIYLGREPLKNGLVDKRKMIDDAQKLLDEFEAGVDASTMIRSLPIAKQQMVEIIKAMSFNSQILVMDEPTSSISDKEVAIHHPMDAMNHKIGLVPENRKEEGLYKLEGVRYNTTIEVLKNFMKGIMVNNEKEHQITQDFIEMFKTKTSSHEHPVGTLSGGNQQKVMISRWLATNPDILILDEPTRGVDVGAKAEIYSIMNELVQKGMAIIMISSELPEIINMSDRVYVMRLGEVVGEFSHEEVSQEKIMRLAAN